MKTSWSSARVTVLIALVSVAAGPANGETLGSAYRESGIANCTAPGTSIEFHLDGTGAARVIKSKTNYDRFRRAAAVKIWRTSKVEKNGMSMIVFDNGRNSRIMAVAGSQKAMGFLADGGVSDMLCQILVEAR